MTLSPSTWRVQLIYLLAIAAAVTAGFWIAYGAVSGLLTAAWMFGFVALVHYGRRRSDTINTMGGVGDERTRTLSLRAIGFTGAVVAVVVPTWWLVTVILGDANETLALVSAITGSSFVVGSFIASRRG